LVSWAFLSQVLRDGKEASCQSAVSRITAFLIRAGKAPPTADTGDYCKARDKLSEFAIKEICIEIAAGAERQVDSKQLWKNRNVYLVDGLTFQMPDTSENQAAHPQHTRQDRCRAPNGLAPNGPLAATLADMKPRQISFASACQFVLAGWQEICRIGDSAQLELYCRKMLLSISQCVVGDRPGRFEPRVVKRRWDQYKKMSQPRATLKKRLEKNDNSFEWNALGHSDSAIRAWHLLARHQLDQCLADCMNGCGQSFYAFSGYAQSPPRIYSRNSPLLNSKILKSEC